MGSLCSEFSCGLWSGGVFPWKSGPNWVPPFSSPPHPVATHSHRGLGKSQPGSPGPPSWALASPHLTSSVALIPLSLWVSRPPALPLVQTQSPPAPRLDLVFSLPAWGAWGRRGPRAAGLLSFRGAGLVGILCPSEPRLDTQAGLPWSPHKRQVRAEQEATLPGWNTCGSSIIHSLRDGVSPAPPIPPGSLPSGRSHVSRDFAPP